ncbi:hypothetical protein JRO89_XS04G0075500 [Xanthoceras sorbifolium]|uniref:Uncharacterized protein n=1 Tax=Xanthoceras sorbifolium TaxID=99658 RepID=A0ABQ8I4Q0_9ROSI|nr:hypothetical protein JRO89_XS04G0075500 [Xanthoceras sorbifolium]
MANDEIPPPPTLTVTGKEITVPSSSTDPSKILLMNPLPSVRQAYSFISQEEKQRLLSTTSAASDSGSSAAMAVRSNNRGNKSIPIRS